MAKVKIVGVSESKGTYKGYDFHNLVVHVERKDNNCLGMRAEQLKVKWLNLDSAFGLGIKSQSDIEKLKLSDFQSIIDKEANAYYDRYGNLERLELIESK